MLIRFSKPEMIVANYSFKSFFLGPCLRQRFLLSFLLLLFFANGCGTLSNGRGWGEDAISLPDLERIQRAAVHSLLDWQTVLPAAGAIIFTINDFDQKVSDWAMKYHPVFGSQNGARNASDYIYLGLQIEGLGTALATPSGGDPKDWAYNKLKGITVEAFALGVTQGATAILKETIDRRCPDRADDSFPSSHTSGAFSAETLANRNLDSIPIRAQIRTPIQAGNILLAAGVAWARVEGGAHYPTDVLVGAALGRFLTAFIHETFIGIPDAERFGLSVTPMKGGVIGQIMFHY